MFAAALFVVAKIHETLNISGNVNEIIIHPNQGTLGSGLKEWTKSLPTLQFLCHTSKQVLGQLPYGLINHKCNKTESTNTINSN